MRGPWVLLALVIGCGDPPLCPSDVFVAIQTSQITADVNAATAGLQADIRVRTSAAEGERVRLQSFASNTLLDDREATADADGLVVFASVDVQAPTTLLRATTSTLCGMGEDEVMAEVRLGAAQLAVEIVNPAVPCGAQIAPAVDIVPAEAGVQIGVRVTAIDASDPRLELTTSSGTRSFGATSDVVVTVEPGANQLVGLATDRFNSPLETAACSVTLADLSISFAQPASGGTLARKDGVVANGELTLDLCGTVNRSGAAVGLSIDGGPAQPATVTGTTWCRRITLTEAASHALTATATVGTSFGSSTLSVRVDVTPPPAVTAFSTVALDRQRLALGWQAPSDNGQAAAAYVIKLATTAITDANFDTIGTVIPSGAPQLPGTVENVLVAARTGTAFWTAIAAIDDVGNRSAVAVFGPVTPGFDRTGAILGPDPAAGSLDLGYAIAHGKFNDDDLEDLAVSAPTQDVGGLVKAGAVYVYFGGSSVIAATPDLVITGTAANATFGSGLARVRWSSASRDDLVVGAPGGNGELLVFEGGATFGTGTRSASTADLRISVDATTPGFFANSGLGRSLVSADIDGDDTLDLIASAPGGGGTIGGIAIIYGGTVTGDAVLSDLDAGGANGAIVELFQDPDARVGRNLGFYVHAVGRLGGAGDTTEDLVIGELDDYAAPNGSIFVLRGDGTRPATAGVSPRAFTIGRDVRIDLLTSLVITEFGSQAIDIEDQNGDGIRDLVVSAYRHGAGQALILSGNAFGVAGIATTADAGVKLTTISGSSNSRFGAFLVGHDAGSPADIDGDGREDLAIGGAPGNVGKMFVWFGGSIPVGNTSLVTAQLVIDAPTTMTFARQLPKGFAAQARWVGDLDGDGLEDLCWASPFDNSGDGSFEVLAD